jgi:aspartate/methionine/tyrosine aminotransferase
MNEMVYSLKKSGKNPIILSYGEAPFIFNKNISFSGVDFNAGAHYSESSGLLELRKKITHYYKRKYKASFKAEQIMVTAGSKIGSAITFFSILDKNDCVLIHEPSWVSYQEHVKLCSARIKFIPYTVLVEDFDKYFENKKIKALVLNNPNNPRGYMYTKEEIIKCAEICKENNSYLIIDESYSDFTQKPFFSGASLLSKFDNIIIMNSFSKNFGLSGWRVGYLITNKSLIGQILKLNQHLVTCAPTILQLFLIKNFEKLEKNTKNQMSSLLKKRAKVQSILKKYNLNFLSGDSTFYFFIKLNDKKINAKVFCLSLLKNKQVATIPGNAYGKNMNNYIRLSFGVEPIKRIEIGIERIAKYLKEHTYVR